MALHELATNAAKYGALSNDRGQIYVDWSAADAAGQFRLTWREVGGPRSRHRCDRALAPS
jgi:two-component sensor histidine kinase